MKKLLTLLLLSGTFLMLSAQDDTVRHLIFTEWRGDTWPQAYIEITNVGDSALNLENFTLQSMPPRENFSLGPADAQLRLSGTLDPGEVYVAIPVMEDLNDDGSQQTRTQVVPFADLLAFRDEGGASLEWDSVSPFNRLFRLWRTYPSAIWYHLPNGDSVVVDAVNNVINEGGGLGGESKPVAGVPDATDTHILVRKAHIKRGNTNWEVSRGTDESDSEWIVIPEDAAGEGKPYTTLGTHGNFPISLNSTVIGIDLTNSKITVPWGLWRGDSLTDEFDIGPGMSWHYIQTADWEDSTHVTNQTGDILEFYACGNSVEKVALEIEVLPPSNDMVLVFPKLAQDDEVDDDGLLPWSMPYYVTEDQPGMDTIGDVPFAIRTDSLFAYLEKADNASWEIVFVDATERPDLQNGDVLKVTGADGTTTKEYYIAVEEYLASDNAYLGAITWPDMPGFISDLWKGDTIPSFNPTSGIYTVKLPYGTTSVPALTALLQDINATVETDRAVSLGGGLAERTTTFTVMAEDDSTDMVYKVTFEVEKDFTSLQKYSPEPFFSEFVARHKAQGCFTEIMNSGNTILDMSKYMIISSKTTKNPGEAIREFITTSDEDYGKRYYKYVPGWKYTTDTTSWRNNPAVLEIDNNVDPMVEPGEVFVIKRAHPVPAKLAENWEEADIIITPSRDQQDAAGRYDYMAVNPWNEALASNNTAAEVFNDNHFLFKIIGDSIFDGDKGLTDPNDFELVDIFADPINAHWTINGKEYAGNAGKQLHVMAKPHVDAGVLSPGVNWGTAEQEGDWIVEKKGQEVATDWEVIQNVGFHVMDPVTKYQSTISSLSYIVSDGFTLEEVKGVVDATNVDDFYGNIIFVDGQTYIMKSTADGAEKTGTDVLADSDTLVVTSMDGTNVTKYVLDVTAGGLDSDAKLVAKTGSGYVVEDTGETGTVSGFPYLTALETVMENVEKPTTANWNVLDIDGNLVPLQQLNADMAYVKTQVSDNIYIEVIAQNGSDKITYQLKPTALSSDAFVVSSFYDVDQEIMNIAKIPGQTSVATLLANVEPVSGATVKVVDKAGFDRPLGIVSYDDKLVVVSQDQSNTVEYYLTFTTEQNPDVPNSAPTVLVVAESSGVKGTAVSFSATVTDDGLPEPATLTYLWEVTSGSAAAVTIANADQMTTDVTFSEFGSFELSLTVSDGELSVTVAHTIEVTWGVGIGMFDMSTISVYPNPASSMINVEFGGESQVESQIRIVDMVGKVAYVGNHFNDQVRISLDGFDAGVYFMIINVDDQSLIRKLNILK